jgi:hypothetical protein
VYFTDKKHAVEVYRGLAPPVGEGHLDSLAHDPDTGVRHHHVQTAKLLLGRFDHRRPGFFESYVLMQKDRRAAGAADLVHHRLTARVIEVRHHCLGAFAREGRRTGRTNPRCAARHDRNLVLNLAHRGPPSRDF